MSRAGGVVRLTVEWQATQRLGAITAAYGSDVLVATDQHIAAATPCLTQVREVLERGGRNVEVHAVGVEQLGFLASAASISEQIRQRAPSTCIALGGGSVIDAAKLALAAVREPWLLDHSVWAKGRGLLAAPAARPLAGAPVLIAVPTRPGSAAHVSDRVCLAAGPGHTRRLVGSSALLPAEVVVDPGHSLALGRHALAESICEVLCRAIEPYLVTERSTRQQDRVGATIVRRIIELGEILLELGDLRPDERVELDQLAMSTMNGAHLDGWAPLSHPWWCIQNSVMTTTKRSKGSLTAQALPTVLERLRAGDERFGSQNRWRRLESRTGWRRRLSDRLASLLASVDHESGRDRMPCGDDVLEQWATDAVSLWTGLVPWVGRSLREEDIRRLLRDAGF